MFGSSGPWMIVGMLLVVLQYLSEIFVPEDFSCAGVMEEEEENQNSEGDERRFELAARPWSIP